MRMKMKMNSFKKPLVSLPPTVLCLALLFGAWSAEANIALPSKLKFAVVSDIHYDKASPDGLIDTILDKIVSEDHTEEFRVRRLGRHRDRRSRPATDIRRWQTGDGEQGQARRHNRAHHHG